MIHKFLREQFRIWIGSALIRYPINGISEYLYVLRDDDLLKALNRKRMTKELRAAVTKELTAYGCHVMANNLGFSIRLDLQTALLENDQFEAFTKLLKDRGTK